MDGRTCMPGWSILPCSAGPVASGYSEDEFSDKDLAGIKAILERSSGHMKNAMSNLQAVLLYRG